MGIDKPSDQEEGVLEAAVGQSYADDADCVVPQRPGWKTGISDMGLVAVGVAPMLVVARDDNSECFPIMNRTFEDIDRYHLSYKLLALIIKKIKENPDKKITIVDVGGGVQSMCLRGILNHPMLKGKIKCINIDPFARRLSPAELQQEGINPDDFYVVSEDIMEANIPENSADVLLSIQMLDFLSDKRLPLVLDRIAAILAPNGEAYLNERWRITANCDFFNPWQVFPHGFREDWLQGIANKHETYMTVGYGDTQLDGSCHLMGSPQSPFLYMSKKRPDGNFPTMEFELAWPEITEAVRSYR